MGFKEKSTGYMEQAFLVLLGLWLKVYRKLQNKPDSEAETLASSSMSFTYHPIPRRAAFLYAKPIDIILLPDADEPLRCWFDLRQVSEVLKFKCNFSVHTTRLGSIIHVADREPNQTFVEIGLIQLLVYAHPAGDIDDDTKKIAMWNLYDNSPMMNGSSLYKAEQVQFEYGGVGSFYFESRRGKSKMVSYLVY
jgi:hypothetical protein